MRYQLPCAMRARALCLAARPACTLCLTRTKLHLRLARASNSTPWPTPLPCADDEEGEARRHGGHRGAKARRHGRATPWGPRPQAARAEQGLSGLGFAPWEDARGARLAPWASPDGCCARHHAQGTRQTKGTRRTSTSKRVRRDKQTGHERKRVGRLATLACRALSHVCPVPSTRSSPWRRSAVHRQNRHTQDKAQTHAAQTLLRPPRPDTAQATARQEGRQRQGKKPGKKRQPLSSQAERRGGRGHRGRPRSLPDLPTHCSGRLCGHVPAAQHSRHCHTPPRDAQTSQHAAHSSQRACPFTTGRCLQSKKSKKRWKPGAFGAGAHTSAGHRSPCTNPCSCRAARETSIQTRTPRRHPLPSARCRPLPNAPSLYPTH